MYDTTKYDARTRLEPGVVGIGPATARKAQMPRKRPAGLSIISADSHVLEADLWVDRFPPHLRDQAPRMVFSDGGWDMRIPGEPDVFKGARGLCELTECVPGMADPKERIKDLDGEGIAKELIFPQRLLVLGKSKLRAHLYRAYNEYMAEDFCSRAPGRFYFAAVPNFWDSLQARNSIDSIKKLGPSACALLLPNKPYEDIHGKPLFWNSYAMDTFWEAVEDSGLPACFHIGEALADGSPGSHLISATTNFHTMVTAWSTLVHGGVFDRHPRLKVVFVEAGISWVPKALQDADLVYNTFDPLIEERTLHHPSWYWHQHCYATFMLDPVGLTQLDWIGADRVMWSTDYPHAESTFGYTQDAIDRVLAAVDEPTARKILSENALGVFKMA